MSLTADDIMKIMEKARVLGLSTIKIEGMEATLGPVKAESAPVPEVKAQEIVTPASIFDDISPEELLYYSTPHYDELQAKKAAHMKALEERAKEQADDTIQDRSKVQHGSNRRARSSNKRAKG